MDADEVDPGPTGSSGRPFAPPDDRGLPAEAARRLARRLGWTAPPPPGPCWVGATSTVFAWGADLAVKIPHRDAASVRACRTDVATRTAAAAVGVSTAAVVTVEDLRPQLRVPVIVSRLLPGHALRPGDATPSVWRAVGADLALMHHTDAVDVPAGLRTFTQSADLDPLPIIEGLLGRGELSPRTSDRLRVLRDRLAPAMSAAGRPVWCHGDVHAENVLAASGRYTGLIDFAGSGWLDSAWDFCAIPVSAVPSALAGYRRAGGRTVGLVERIGWCRLQTAVHRLPATDRAEGDANRSADRIDSLLG